MAQANRKTITAARHRARSKADPIFALIAASKKADQIHLRAARALWKKRNALDEQDRKNHVPPLQYRTASFPQFNYKGRLFTFDADVERFVKHYFNNEVASNLGPEAARRIGKLARYAERELKQMLRAHHSRHDRLQKQLGLTAREDADQRTGCVAFAAFKTMCETTPRTMAGFSAMLSHLKALYQIDGLRALDDGRGSLLFTTLAEAAQKLSPTMKVVARRG